MWNLLWQEVIKTRYQCRYVQLCLWVEANDPGKGQHRHQVQQHECGHTFYVSFVVLMKFLVCFCFCVV